VLGQIGGGQELWKLHDQAEQVLCPEDCAGGRVNLRREKLAVKQQLQGSWTLQRRSSEPGRDYTEERK